jgi:uncharacterized protein YcbK (DUF882 family)
MVMGGSLLVSSAHAAAPKSHARPVVVAPFAATPLITVAGAMPEEDDDVPTVGPKYSLNLQNLHTHESLNVVYRVGDTYIPEALEQLNHFLRDHNNDEVSHYDPKEFDLLHNVMAKLGRVKGEIDVVCGYRTQETNDALRRAASVTGVAEHSQHILAKAIDIRVPGVITARLRDAALSLSAGGVGYYPKSQFVHVDVGPVRTWTFGGAAKRSRKRVVHRA